VVSAGEQRGHLVGGQIGHLRRGERRGVPAVLRPPPRVASYRHHHDRLRAGRERIQASPDLAFRIVGHDDNADAVHIQVNAK